MAYFKKVVNFFNHNFNFIRLVTIINSIIVWVTIFSVSETQALSYVLLTGFVLPFALTLVVLSLWTSHSVEIQVALLDLFLSKNSTKLPSLMILLIKLLSKNLLVILLYHIFLNIVMNLDFINQGINYEFDSTATDNKHITQFENVVHFFHYTSFNSSTA